ncbi:hypothetical protein E0Z10_g4233 [Xylaria hypoxylon]|uniref:Uncharacterized protein n=1 Tax=Xylaria hypoxylon TaxID=37992 RepID=A0A4Z0YZA1_9PEZI|nr:hypothetical protein E0Z10_g4233 [Xylaria hypoxylon]
MTDSVDNRPSTADNPPDTQRLRTPPPFAPVFTLVNNASTRTTHHPHVRYIFSDDDPDILTQALAECEHTYADESGSEPAPANRTILLDLASNDDGRYSVSWASSLSPSWAILNAQLSQISPPSSDTGQSSGSGAGDAGTDDSNRPDRLMLRIEGVETSAPSSSSELRISNETSHQRSGSASGSGSGSGQRERERAGEADDYASMLGEFEKRMITLRNVVNASEDRRKKIAPQTVGEGELAAQDKVTEDTTTSV